MSMNFEKKSPIYVSGGLVDDTPPSIRGMEVYEPMLTKIHDAKWGLEATMS